MTHVVPNIIGKWIGNCGIEYVAKNKLGRNLSPFAAYDFRTITLDKTSVNNTITAGIIIGRANGNAVRLHYTYYAGKSIHGEYFNVAEKYSAFGINLDL